MRSLTAWSMKVGIVFALAGVVLAVAGCGTSPVSLEYRAPTGPGAAPSGPRVVMVGAFADRRGLGPHYVGVVKSPVGTPIHYVETRIPVAQVVGNGFGYGLEVRNMRAQPGASRFVLGGEIQDLQSEHLARPYASARILVTLMDRRSNQVVFQKVYRSERLLPARVPSEEGSKRLLAGLASQALGEVIDQALDDPAFRAVLGGQGVRY
jgi:hypothetical protein